MVDENRLDIIKPYSQRGTRDTNEINRFEDIFLLMSHRYSTNIFQRCRIGLSAARGGTVEAKVATYLHPVGLQRLSGSNEGTSHHPVALGWMPTLCLWRKQCGGIRSASGDQN